MSNAISLDQITKRYGNFTAVDALSLNVPSGKIVGFLGPNGAGKTTTIRMIMSIIYPDEGNLDVLGAPRALDVKDRIGYLPEERGLYRNMTVEQTLRYFGRLKGLSGHKLRERIDTCLKRVELADWRRKKCEALSKGMGQKIQFITTILHEPELVILDEPFSGLDPLNMELLKDMVLDLKAQGTTVIFSTHQMEQAQRLCDELMLINRGRCLISGTIEDIRARFTTSFLELEGQGDFDTITRLPGVSTADSTATTARLELNADTEPNDFLTTAINHVQLTRFELQRPTLHEIFVKLVREDLGEEAAAAAEADLDASETPAGANA